jgi:predicted DNA-binding protein
MSIARRTQTKTSITVFVETDDLVWMDDLAKRLGRTRSEILRGCIGMAREDWEMMESVGITPERLASWMSMAERMRSWFRQGVEEGEIPC